jgi:hypothetical protein
MNTLKTLLAATAAMATLAVASPSLALALVVGTGWQSDEIDAAHMPSLGSPITFTVGAGKEDLFSFTDCCIPGDSYTVMVNGATAFSTFHTLYPTPFDDSLGDGADFAGPWTDTAFAHLQLGFAPGSYSLTVEGDGIEGLPAGFGVRLDPGVGVGTQSGTPEPATWAAMLLGFGGIGAALRKRRQRASLAF